MRKGIVPLDWSLIGAMLAQGGDVEQAEFLKAFVKECRSWGTRLQVEQQLAYVNLKLSDEEKDTLSMLSYKDTDR